MKKFLSFLVICLFCILLSACNIAINTDKNNNNNNNTNVNNNNNQNPNKEPDLPDTPDLPDNPDVPDQPEEPETPTDSVEYTNYINELKTIVNVEKNKIFERYGDFTEELENYLYFGDYPGREVTNSELIAKLEAITETNEFGYLEVDDLKFVKVEIKNTYDSLEIGNEEYENSTKYKIGTIHYFLVEPILWRVLTYNPTTGQAFLLSNNIIEAQVYVNETNDRYIDGRVIYPSNYEYSDIREWCNDEFVKQAFSQSEKERIQLSTISNLFSTYNYEYKDDRDTEDYVFIPSFKEMTSSYYGFENTGIFSYSRFSTPSDYASAKGVYTSNLEEQLPDSGLYLIRGGAEFLKSYIYFVKFDGYALSPYYVNSPSTGVRVCTKINLND